MIMMGTASSARPSRNSTPMATSMNTSAEVVKSSDHWATTLGTWLRTRIHDTTLEVPSSR